MITESIIDTHIELKQEVAGVNRSLQKALYEFLIESIIRQYCGEVVQVDCTAAAADTDTQVAAALTAGKSFKNSTKGRHELRIPSKLQAGVYASEMDPPSDISLHQQSAPLPKSVSFPICAVTSPESEAKQPPGRSHACEI